MVFNFTFIQLSSSSVLDVIVYIFCFVLIFWIRPLRKFVQHISRILALLKLDTEHTPHHILLSLQGLPRLRYERVTLLLCSLLGFLRKTIKLSSAAFISTPPTNCPWVSEMADCQTYGMALSCIKNGEQF